MNHKKRVAAFALLAISLTGCAAYDNLYEGAGAGGAAGAGAAAGNQGPIYAPPPQQNIDDPDQPITDQMIDYVWGDDLEDAAQNCKRLAENAGLTYKGVKRTSQRSGGKRYECWVSNNHPESTNVPYSDRRR